MTFNELFETLDEKLEKYFKTSTDWHWHDEQDFHTHEWSTVARCQLDEKGHRLLKRKGVKLNDQFSVRGIGTLKYQYDSFNTGYYAVLMREAE